MKKKTKLKGGNFNKYGYFIPDNIKYRFDKGLKTELLDKYETNKKDALIEYDAEFNKKKQSDTIEMENKKNNFNYVKLNKENWREYTKIGSYYFNTISNIITNIISGLYELIIVNSRSFIYSFIRIFVDIFKSQGVIPKFIIFIITIFIIFGLVFAFSPSANKANTDSYNTYQDKFNKMNTNLFIKPEDLSIGKYMSDFFVAFIPEKYRFSFNSTYNKANLMFGNDIISKGIDTYRREEITDNNGRFNNINHIKTDDSNKVYSLFKPGNIDFSFDLTNNPNVDFFKLPKNIQDLYKSNKYRIEPTINSQTGMYEYKMDNLKIGDDNTGNIYFPHKLFPNFVLPYLDDNISNTYIMNSIKNTSNNFTNENRQNIKNMNNYDINVSKYTYPSEYISNNYMMDLIKKIK